MHRILIFCLFFCSTVTHSQTFNGKNYGITIGAHLAAGTHFMRAGISCSGYFIHRSVQINPGVKLYFNFRNIGPGLKYTELAASLGFITGFGRRDSVKNIFFDPLQSQLKNRNAAGYSFNYYLNRIKTSQATGSLMLQIGKFQLLGEDDVFAGGIRDEFRTGAFMVRYHSSELEYGLSLFTGWTGKRGVPVTNSDYPSRNGYMDMSRSLYGNVSAGLVSFQVSFASKAGQVYRANAGLDDEHIRNLFQNKFVHRFFFSPGKERWRGGADLPMIDTNGEMYLYRKNQKVRKASPYFNLFVNPSIFY